MRLASRLGLSTDDLVNQILFNDSIQELTTELKNDNDINESNNNSFSPVEKRSNVSFFPKNFFLVANALKEEDDKEELVIQPGKEVVLIFTFNFLH